MRVSIVIPAYNSQSYLAATLDSVIAQTLPDWELVIVDDGSKDDTPQIIDQYARRDSRIRSVRQENAGIARARNRGFKETHPATEYVAFLDHDDLWEPNALETVVLALEQNPHGPAAYGLARFIDQSGAPFRAGELERWHYKRKAIVDGRLVNWPVDAPATFETLIVENKIVTVGQVLFRRSALLGQPGIFDPRMVPCDDWELYLRITQTGPIAFVHKVALGRRIHSENTSNNLSLMHGSDHFIRRFYASSNGIPEQYRALAVSAYRLIILSASQHRLDWAKEAILSGQPICAAKHLRHAAREYARYLSSTPPTPPDLTPSPSYDNPQPAHNW